MGQGWMSESAMCVYVNVCMCVYVCARFVPITAAPTSGMVLASSVTNVSVLVC